MNHKVTSFICSVILLLVNFSQSAEILWVHYTQHRDTLKLMVHLDANPEDPVSEEVHLAIKTEDEGWREIAVGQMYTLSSSVLFELKKWPNYSVVPYRVTTDDSELTGVFRAMPPEGFPVKMMGVGNVADTLWPWSAAVNKMIEQDPDLVYFSGKQFYFDDYNVSGLMPQDSCDVAKGVHNYLQKYQRFGQAFRDLLKDRPSIIIANNADQYHRACHSIWWNSTELTCVGTLPDAHYKGRNKDGLLSYYTSVDYGGVRFAVLEDRKFKSAPAINNDGAVDFLSKDSDLQLLGSEQERFLGDWAKDLKQAGKIGAVLSHSSWACLTCDTEGGIDLSSNGWPQSGRNRAIKAICDVPVLMVNGNLGIGALYKHGINNWQDGPLSLSIPPFSSRPATSLKPLTGDGSKFTDAFGNKVSVRNLSVDKNGYSLITFDPRKKSIRVDFITLDQNLSPNGKHTPGWPYEVTFK